MLANVNDTFMGDNYYTYFKPELDLNEVGDIEEVIKMNEMNRSSKYGVDIFKEYSDLFSKK